MPGDVFYWLFNMSITAAICGVPVLILRAFKRLPRRVLMLLWFIPFIRMCIPIGISGKYGLMTLLSKITTKTVTVYKPLLSTMNHVQAAESYYPITYKVNVVGALFHWAAVVWLTVAAALIIAFLIIYFGTLRELGGARQLRDNIFVSDKVKTPAVYGILRPRIILPCEYDESTLHFILLHENAHIRRGDNFWRVLALILTCVHWFNTLCWLFLKKLYSDIELACDETVLKSCDDEQKKQYAHVLVSSVEKTNVFASSLGGASVRLRIKNILCYKRLTVMSAIGALALIVAMAYILLTNAAV